MPQVLLTMPRGTIVDVRLDDGRVVRATTTSAPWQLPSGHWLVKTTATGPVGFNLARCTIVRPDGFEQSG